MSTRLKDQGFTEKNTGSHSLRSGGAMALKLNGADPLTIMKAGRWTSLTFQLYIHSQIAHLSKGWATTMARPIPFFNILPPTPIGLMYQATIITTQSRAYTTTHTSLGTI
jgi:hypothetical protein